MLSKKNGAVKLALFSCGIKKCDNDRLAVIYLIVMRLVRSYKLINVIMIGSVMIGLSDIRGDVVSVMIGYLLSR